MKEQLSFAEMEEKLLKQAEEKGLANNYIFATTFQRYKIQTSILAELEVAIKEYGSTVTKEYVKGRQNLCVNPAITEYNKTTTACNGTVSTILNIFKTLPAEDTTASLAEQMEGLMADAEE